MMLITMFSISFGLFFGSLFAGTIVYLVMKRRMDVHENVSRVTSAVADTHLETRIREIENLNFRLQETRQHMAKTEENLQTALVSEASLKTSLAEQQNQNKEKLALLDEAKERMNTEFKNIANEIFESKQQLFKAESKEQLGNLLSPLSDRIKEFEKRVETAYNEESKERYSLTREIRNLQDLNARISKDAINLTNALKGENKTQGTWGEIILERVLEKSGLERGREYEIQVSMKNEEGRRLQPDVVVHLPEGRDVVIDSKVSLNAYERYCSAEDDIERAESLKLHIQSLRSHIKQLGAKDYHNLDGLRTLDFVLLFVPIEAAFSLAVQTSNDLFSDAFDKNIVMVAPSTLLATLRTIQNIWRYEQQNKNAQEIASRAGALYDKFVNFVSDLENIGARIESTQAAYRDAHNKLTSGKGNLVRRAEGMRELGAKVSKSLPQNLVEMPALAPVGDRKVLKAPARN
ncbi:MAG: DNA recombination protein RmuC [Gammaproteobacteria bacterium]|nr:DNA recombination protein RmuC [Gammaproteobacteria bacterium]